MVLPTQAAAIDNLERCVTGDYPRLIFRFTGIFVDAWALSRSDLALA
jgi:hypothetical protein